MSVMKGAETIPMDALIGESPFDHVKDIEKGEDSSFDDTASTSAPSSVDWRSVLSTPDLCPLESGLDVDSLSSLSPAVASDCSELELLEKRDDNKVCIIHHDDMKLHAPPRSHTVFELPRRVIGIENCLKGIETTEGIPKRNWGNSPMEFLRSPVGKHKRLVVGFGSVASKRRRMSLSTGVPCEGSIWSACFDVQAPIVQDSDLRLVHTRKHIDKVKELCKMAEEKNVSFFPLDRAYSRKPETHKGILNDDIYYSPHSLVAMKRAAGGAVEAVRQLFDIDKATGRSAGRSGLSSSYAIVRPPGHHCCSDPNGFCFFNNTAIAAAHARQVLGIPRVVIVDWDYHHGDGQQQLFYKDPSVLCISLHVAIEKTKSGKLEMAFPGNKSMDINYNGCGEGEGYNINIPWPHDRVAEPIYKEAFQSIVIPAIQAFDPQLILVASGFDAVCGDNLAGTRLVPSAYYNMTRQLLSLQKPDPENPSKTIPMPVPVAVVLEGGYNPRLLAQGSLNVIHALLGRDPPAPDDVVFPQTTEAECCRDVESEAILDAVRRRLNTLAPWKDLRRPGCGDSYFHESSSLGAAASQEVAQKVTELIAQRAYKP